MADVDKIKILIETEVKKAKKDLEGLIKQQKKYKKDNDTLGQTLKKNWLKIAAGIAAAFVVIKKAFNLAKEFAEFRQGAEAMQRQFGVNADVIIKKLKEVSGGTISMKDAVVAANRAMALNVTKDVGQIGDLMEFARLRARAMGIDTSQAFNDIVTGIGRGSPLILDNLGIITKGWNKEAAAAGKAFDAQFILNKVLKQAGEELERTGELVITDAERIQTFDAAVEDLGLKLGKILLPVMREVISGLNFWIKMYDKLVSKSNFIGRAQERLFEIKRVKAYTDAQNEFANVSTDNLIKQLEKTNRKFERQQAIKQMIADGDSKEGVAADTRFLKKVAMLEGERQAIQAILEERRKLAEEEAKAEARLDKEIEKFQARRRDRLTVHQEYLEELLRSEELNAKQRAAVEEELAKTKQDILIRDLENTNKHIATVGGIFKSFSDLQIALMEKQKAKGDEVSEAQKKRAKRMIIIQRAISMVEALINTALAVTQTLADRWLPTYLKIPMAIGIGAAGGAQVALIASQSIPQFQQGGTFGRGGRALVGEQGPELVELPGGSRIIDNRRTQEILNHDNRNLTFNIQATNLIDLVNELKREYGVEVFS